MIASPSHRRTLSKEKRMGAIPGRTLRSAVVLSCLAAGVAGCGGAVTVGRDFDYASFGSRAQVGTTEAAQVREWLGAPAGVGTEVAGETRLEVWTYYFGSGVLPGGASTKFKLLQVKFNSQGKVAGWSWSGDTATVGVEDKSTTKPKN
jgi:hypothetical protein